MPRRKRRKRGRTPRQQLRGVDLVEIQPKTQAQTWLRPFTYISGSSMSEPEVSGGIGNQGPIAYRSKRPGTVTLVVVRRPRDLTQPQEGVKKNTNWAQKDTSITAERPTAPGRSQR